MDRAQNLLGASSIQEAQVDQWLIFGQLNLAPHFRSVLGPIFGWMEVTAAANAEGQKAVKDHVRTVNNALEGREWLVGESVTLADYALAALFMMYAQTILEKNYRKSVPHFSAWFERVAADAHFIKQFGKVHMCEKSVKGTAIKK